MAYVTFSATAQPAAEPVTLAELRAQTRVDDAAEDALLDTYLVAARQHAETFMGRPIRATPMRGRLQGWPADGNIIIDAPVISISAVTYTNEAGAQVAWTDFVTRPVSGELTELRPARGASWPTLGDDPVIEITITAGWADDLIPGPVRMAILHIAATWHNSRESVEIGKAVNELPNAGAALLKPFCWRMVA